MENPIFTLLLFSLSLGAFLYGAIALFRKKTPLYFQLIVCAAGCYALEELCSLVTFLCGGFEYPITVSAFGTFGCFFFLLSANYGQLDGVVDDGTPEYQKARRLSLLAPVFVGGILLLCLFKAYQSFGVFAVVSLALIYAPMLFASYFNLKHLLIPVDAFGFLKATRLYNVWALLFYGAQILYLTAYSFQIPVDRITTSLISLTLLGMVIAAVKGAKLWKTLI